MDRATYSAASAEMAALRRVEVINNNLANSNTAGFKRGILVGQQQTFESTLAATLAKDDPFARGDHDRSPGVVSLEAKTDFSQGAIQATGNPLDVALRNPKDFFVVNGPSGPLYTRAGNFTMNVAGEIVTADGLQVSGDGGAIATTGVGVSISDDGSVRSNGQTVGRLQVVRIEDTTGLRAAGGTRFSLQGGSTPAQVDADLASQSLEMSNVSVISAMIDLIAANRGFEMATKATQTVDGLNQAAISQVGRK